MERFFVNPFSRTHFPQYGIVLCVLLFSPVHSVTLSLRKNNFLLTGIYEIFKQTKQRKKKKKDKEKTQSSSAVDHDQIQFWALSFLSEIYIFLIYFLFSLCRLVHMKDELIQYKLYSGEALFFSSSAGSCSFKWTKQNSACILSEKIYKRITQIQNSPPVPWNNSQIFLLC